MVTHPLEGQKQGLSGSRAGRGGAQGDRVGWDPIVTCGIDLLSIIQNFFLSAYYVLNAVLGSYNHEQTDTTLPSQTLQPNEQGKK